MQTSEISGEISNDSVTAPADAPTEQPLANTAREVANLELEQRWQTSETQRLALEARLAAAQSEVTQAVTAYSELVRSLPGVVPSLVKGATLAEVQSSLESSRLAYAEAVRSTPVSAGGGNRVATDAPDALAGERGFSLILQGVQRGRGGGLYS